MANNVEVTQGTGTTFKTTDNAGVHTGHINVDASALPTGAATSAKQDTIIGHVDGIEALLTTIDADTGAIATDAAAIEALLTAMDADTSTLAAAVAGSEMQVDVVAALPAGDNNIGNVDIASAIPAGDNNIGNVDLASAIPAGTNNIGDVDVVSVSGGVAANAADTATPVKVGARYDSTTPTYDNGDVTNLQSDARGSLHVVLRQPGADAAISGGDLANDGLSTGTIALMFRALGYMFNGTSVDRMRGDTTNGLDVDVTRVGGQVEVKNATNGLSNRVFAVDFATLTRPANTTAYSAADSISNNATAGSVTALVSGNISDTNDDPIFISEILVRSTDTGLAGKKLRAYLFNSDPTANSGVGAGDNAAYSQKIAGYVGSFVGVMETGFSDGSVGRLLPTFNDANGNPAGAFVPVRPVSGARTLYIQYQAVEAFTPSANSTTIIGTAKGWQGRAA
jgi:hypothetical protein